MCKNYYRIFDCPHLKKVKKLISEYKQKQTSSKLKKSINLFNFIKQLNIKLKKQKYKIFKIADDSVKLSSKLNIIKNYNYNYNS